MLLFEAKNEIDKRLEETMQTDYREHIPEYFEALEIASKAIDAQMRLADMLNDFWNDTKELDTFSARLTYELLSSIRFDWRDEE